MLSVTLARPPPTAEELQYKRGVRGDNRAADRGAGVAGAGRRGWRFFEDDEDRFGLEELLQVGLGVGAGARGRAWGARALAALLGGGGARAHRRGGWP